MTKLISKFCKVLSLIGMAFITAVGTDLGEKIINSLDKLSDSDPSLMVQVIPSEGFYSSHPQAPYKVIQTPNTIPQELLDSDDISEAFDYYHSLGGIDGSTQFVQLELRGNSKEPITINKIKVHTVKKTEPVKGWFIADATCGAGLSTIVEVNLDEVMPQLKILKYDLESDEHRPGYLSISNTKIEILEVHATTRKYLVHWYLEIFYTSSENNRASVIVKNIDGEPFKITSEIGSTAYAFGGIDSAIYRREDWDNGLSYC